MAYTEQELGRVVELFEQIEGNKEHEYAAQTYKDVPALKEMADIMMSRDDKTADIVEEKITAYTYIARAYDSMCRAGISVKFYKLLLEAYADLCKERALEDEEKKYFEEALVYAARAYNYYEHDDCAELIEIVSGSMPDEKIKECIDSAIEYRSSCLKNDPVEKTEKYLAVIDEVEEKIEKNKRIDLCHEYWGLKSDYLMEHGISWQSPAILNPGVMFD